jgi:hypothetical protein
MKVILQNMVRLSLTTDIKMSDMPPRWPPELVQGAYENSTWELASVDSSSISFVTAKIMKVRYYHDSGFC